MAPIKKPKGIKTVKGSRRNLEEIALSTMADVHFITHKSVFNAAIEALIAKLVVNRQAIVPGFGYFQVVHVSKFRHGDEIFESTVVFTPEDKLIKQIEDINVKF